MAQDPRSALLAAMFAVAATTAQAQASVKPSTGTSPAQTVAVPATSTVTQAPTQPRLPGAKAVHVNPAASAASGSGAVAAVQPASGVRPTLRNAQDPDAITATREGSPTPGTAQPSVRKPTGD